MNSSHNIPEHGLYLDFCSHDAAIYAIRHWYYRSEMPVGKLVRIGCWEDGSFIGVVLFGMSASNALMSPYGLQQTEGCELSRVAFREHTAPMTRIIKIALLLLHRHDPGLRLVVSFADPTVHLGKIYQAGGWIYTGRTAPDHQYRDHTGKIWHSREVSSTGYKNIFNKIKKVPKMSECEKIPIPGKHRYIYPFDPSLRLELQRLAKPYPKDMELKNAFE